MHLSGVRPSVPPWSHSGKLAAAGLLVLAWSAGDIDRLLYGAQQRLANAGSATLSACVGS